MLSASVSGSKSGIISCCISLIYSVIWALDRSSTGVDQTPSVWPGELVPSSDGSGDDSSLVPSDDSSCVSASAFEGTSVESGACASTTEPFI